MKVIAQSKLPVPGLGQHSKALSEMCGTVVQWRSCAVTASGSGSSWRVSAHTSTNRRLLRPAGPQVLYCVLLMTYSPISYICS